MAAQILEQKDLYSRVPSPIKDSHNPESLQTCSNNYKLIFYYFLLHT